MPSWPALILSTLLASTTLALPLLTACTGTRGDLLRTTPDGGTAVTPRPRPPALASWQIQLSGSLDTSADVQLYIADVETPPSVIRALHEAGRIMICYFSAGTTESFRADAARFPASSVGQTVANYPDERWLDVRDAPVRAIMRDRVTRAADVGCDGIHPSGLAAYAATTGFAFSRNDQIAYARWLAVTAHDLGLSIGLVENDANLAAELVADFDWTVVFGCLASGCPSAAPFVTAQKAAFLVEYGDAAEAAAICPKAKALGLSALIKRNANLDAFRVGCP